MLVDTVGCDRLFFSVEDHDPVLRVRRRLGHILRSRRPNTTLPTAGWSALDMSGDYRLAVAMVRTAWDVDLLETVRDLRQRVDRVVLWVSEMWPSGVVPELRHSPFHLADLVLVGTTAEAARGLDELIEPPVRFMPAGIDVDTFAPCDAGASRPIDLFNIGRRDPHLHDALLDRARNASWFYVFDTTSGALLQDHRQHRWQLAQNYRAAKLAMTSAAKFDLVDTGEGQLRAMPNRVFEALASGAVMVGAPPPSADNQREQIGSIVVHELPSNPHDAAAEVHRLLDADLTEERRRNVELARRFHDWSDRWLRVFDLLDLPAPVELERRNLRIAQSAGA